MGRIVPDRTTAAPGGANITVPLGTDGESASTFSGTVTVPAGTDGEASSTHKGSLAVPAGTDGEALALTSLTGAGSAALGTDSESAALYAGSLTLPSIGSDGQSFTVLATTLARGMVTTATTAGGTVWTNPTNVEADDSSTATWTVTDSTGAGAGVTSTGTLTATNPKLGVTPSGWTRSKVETLVHYNDSAVGLAATGDTATFTVALQSKTGAALQTVVSDSFTAAGSHTDATVATDVTAAVAAISDTDLALTKFLLTASFARTLAAVGTRSWTVNVDSLSLRVTYTRSGIT